MEVGGRGPVFDGVVVDVAHGGHAAIQHVARGAYAGGAAAAGLRLRARHPRERLRQLGLHQALTHPERPAVVQVERGGRRPAAVLFRLWPPITPPGGGRRTGEHKTNPTPTLKSHSLFFLYKKKKKKR